MAQKLKESILSKVEPKDTNVVWYQPTEGGIKGKVYNGGWKDFTKSDVKIGENAVIGDNITIGSDVTIGSDIKIKWADNGVNFYSDFDDSITIGNRANIGRNVLLGTDLYISTGKSDNADSIEIKISGFGESIYIPFGFDGNKIGSATKVTWNANSNMNDFKEAGVYDIYGERTVITDNMPILNTGGGHSISARLTVVVSSLQPANSEKCITQFLMLSNRHGGDGNMYVRTYNENNNGLYGWSEWKKQQGMVESYINTDTMSMASSGIALDTNVPRGLNGMTENGMYSGIYTDDPSFQAPTFVETFVLIVINDYAASGKLNLPRHITQLKYAVDAITGQSTVKKRVGTGDNDITWSIWADVEGDTNHSIYETLNLLVQNVDTKAPKVGYAPDLKVGAADELTSKDIAESHQISIIRPTGNASINNGNAIIEKIKGKSIVWNQQIKNPDFSNGLENWSAGSGAIIEVNSDGSIKVTSKEEQYNKDIRQRAVSKGHVYLFCIKLKSSFNGEVGVYLGGGNSVAKYNVVKDETLVYRDIKVADHFDTLFRPVSILNAPSGSSVDIYHAYLYDLTQMFGAGNEPNTIEEFDAMKPYGVTNDYNAGEVVSYVGANTLKSVGVNIWDEQWEVGGLSNGEPTNNSTQIRSKNFIPCIGGMEYYGYMGWSSKDYLHVAIFDENKVWQYNIGVNRKTFTIPDNAAYIKIFTKHECGYGNAYKGDICISLSQSGKQENRYVSYEEDSIKLLNPLVINDSTGNPLFPNGLLSAGDVYDEITTTEAIKRIAIVNLGDLAWNKDENIGPRWDAFLPETIKAVQGWNKIGWLNTTKYNVGTVGFDGVENKIGVYGKTVYVQDNSYASKESFKESMQGVYLYYELSEPIVVNISENTDVQYKVWNCGTEGFIAEGKTTPLNADLIYPFNAVGRILENNAQISALQETDNEIINSVEDLKASVDTKADNTIYDSLEEVERKMSWDVDLGEVSKSAIAEERAIQLANDKSILLIRYTTSEGQVGTIRQVFSDNQGTMQYLTLNGSEYVRIVYSNGMKSNWRNISKASLVYKLQYDESSRLLSFHDPIQDVGFGGVTLPGQVVYDTPQEFRGQHKWGSFFMNLENVNTRSDFQREDGTTGSLDDSYGNNKTMKDGIYEYLKQKQISQSHQYCHAGIKVECFDGKLFADIIVKSGGDGMLLFATIICDLAIAGDYTIVSEKDLRQT